MREIREADGARITAAALEKERKFFITDFGAVPEKSGDASHCLVNTEAVNRAVGEAAQNGGGTVVIPSGEFKVYTIHMQSGVNLYLSEGAVLRAARTDIENSYEKQTGEGGNYEEPEANRYAGLQDHGHSYFANSLIYGADLTEVMIYGPGRIDGSFYDEEGFRQYVLMGGDPADGGKRNLPGHAGEWFGNKGIALVRCKEVVLKDISIVIGGHFAVIAEGVEDLLIDHVLIDTTRDALDVDCCKNVTVRNSVFNSLTDDALVMKASFGAGRFMPLSNVLIEDCTVSGYDAGSVYAGTYTHDKLIATDRCGPTGRVKLGTESTCGYERVTVRRTRFERSRGFALEAVDGSDLTDIIFTDCEMENISSSPIFLRVGDRGRFPVTGMSREEDIEAKAPNVRLDNRTWVLPDTENYVSYPARRYLPAYRKNRKVTVDGHSEFFVVSPDDPVRVNEANLVRTEKGCFAKTYAAGKGYMADQTAPLSEREQLCRGNGSGSSRPAKIDGVRIENVTIRNADPRYPMLIMGLKDSPVENVVLKNIRAEFRGGMTMKQAVEQRQLNTSWEYSQYETAPSVQTLPWLVNTFFLKEEGLLPRVDWDPETKAWKDDPYNVPEMPAVYPEPSNWGILPAYGLYVRHAKHLEIDDMKLSFLTEDERHAAVFDDAEEICIRNLGADIAEGQAQIACVTDLFRRPTGREYVPDEPYCITTVSDLTVPENVSVLPVSVKAPAPGTPADSLYSFPTLPCSETGYHFAVPTETYPLPRTVFRPFFSMNRIYGAKVGEELVIPVCVRDPAAETSEKSSDGQIYNEAKKQADYTVQGEKRDIRVAVWDLPEGAVFDEGIREIHWTPKASGKWTVLLEADDGIIPEKAFFTIEVKE